MTRNTQRQQILNPILRSEPLEGTDPTAWRRQHEEHGFPDPLLDLIASRFRLLSEPLRLKLLAALADGERSVGELATLTGAGQPNVSKHLAILAQGGLVRRRKAGTTTYYAIADATAFSLCDAVCAGLQAHFAAQADILGLPRRRNETEQE